jgi:large subunit ribosomal protein L7/L12
MMILTASSPDLASAKELKKLVVTKTYPKQSEMNVMVESKVSIRFSETIQKGFGISKISFQGTGSNYIAYTYEIKGNILQIIPKKNLKYGTKYTVFIPANAIKNKSGKNMGEEYYFTFITEDDPDQYSGKEEQEAVGDSSHRISIEASMKDELSDEEKAYLIETLKSIGVNVKSVDVELIVAENAGESAEATEETAEASDIAEGASQDTSVETTNDNESDSFDVILVNSGDNRIPLIQALRRIAALGLREAKDIADNPPKVVKEGVSRVEAERAVTFLEEVGANASIVPHVHND